MTDTTEEPNVTLITFNAGMQLAVDDTGRTWIVDCWLDSDGDELMERFANPDQLLSDTTPNVNWDVWELVEACTAYSDFTDHENPQGQPVRKWVSFRPDDFDMPTPSN